MATQKSKPSGAEPLTHSGEEATARGPRTYLSDDASDALHGAASISVLLQWIERARDAHSTIEMLEEHGRAFRESHAAIPIDLPEWGSAESAALASLAIAQEDALRRVLRMAGAAHE
jgi:hypothetical protein